MKKKLVICGFPGVGKTYLFENPIHNCTIHDSDSSKFSWSEPGVRNPEFPKNYIDHILSLPEGDIVLASTHATVIEALKDESLRDELKVIIVYPSMELKKEYLSRYRIRGSEKTFVETLDKNWESFVTSLDEEKDLRKMRFNSKETTLSDVLGVILAWYPND